MRYAATYDLLRSLVNNTQDSIMAGTPNDAPDDVAGDASERCLFLATIENAAFAVSGLADADLEARCLSLCLLAVTVAQHRDRPHPAGFPSRLSSVVDDCREALAAQLEPWNGSDGLTLESVERVERLLRDFARDVTWVAALRR